MNNQNYKVLLVDDEKDILELIRYNLEKEGFQVDVALNGIECLKKAVEFLPNLILLVIMMPEMDGIETCYKLKAIPELKATVIAFLSARNEDYTQIAALDAGADDFIQKPVKIRLLVSKIQSLLRRNGLNVSIEDIKSIEQNADLIIDKEKFLVIQNGTKITLPKKEFELIVLLSSIPERVFNREEIYRKVWGNNLVVGDRTIDVHIRKLREKLGENYIQTIKGVGYKFNPKELI